MPDLGIQQFRSIAATAGTFSDSHVQAGAAGGLKAESSFFGRAVNWSRVLFGDEGAKQSNRAVTESLLTAIKSSYGEASADVVKGSLQDRIDAGKPLTAHVIKNALAMAKQDMGARVAEQQNRVSIALQDFPRLFNRMGLDYDALSPREQQALKQDFALAVKADKRGETAELTKKDLQAIATAVISSRSPLAPETSRLGHVANLLPADQAAKAGMGDVMAHLEGMPGVQDGQKRVLQGAVANLGICAEILTEAPAGRAETEQHLGVLKAQTEVLREHLQTVEGLMLDGLPEAARDAAGHICNELNAQIGALGEHATYLQNFIEADPLSAKQLQTASDLWTQSAVKVLNDQVHTLVDNYATGPQIDRDMASDAQTASISARKGGLKADFGEKLKDPETFGATLARNEVHSAFSAFVRSEFSAENLQFFDATSAQADRASNLTLLQAGPNARESNLAALEGLARDARAIQASFVGDAATTQVNLPSGGKPARPAATEGRLQKIESEIEKLKGTATLSAADASIGPEQREGEIRDLLKDVFRPCKVEIANLMMTDTVPRFIRSPEMGAVVGNMAKAEARAGLIEAFSNEGNVKVLKDLSAALKSEQGGVVSDLRDATINDATGDKKAMKQAVKALAKERPKDLEKQIEAAFKQVGLPTAHLKEDLHHAHLDVLNKGQSWNTIERGVRFTHEGQVHQASSEIRPAAQMAKIFGVAYNGGGVSCATKTESEHAVNLASTSLKDSQNRTVFQGIRHGVHSAWGIANGDERVRANDRRAQESVLAALTLKPDLMAAALNGDEVTLPLTSISLMTPDAIRGTSLFKAMKGPDADERTFIREQLDTWKRMNDSPGPQLITAKHPETGQEVQLKIRVDVAAFNFGVNAGAVASRFSGLDMVGGWGQVRADNEAGLHKLVGDLEPGTVPGGRLAAALNSPTLSHQEKANLRELAEQIRNLWQDGSYMRQGHEPYKLASRVAVLTHMMDQVPLWNCKSGKDRTGMLDGEAKLLAMRIQLLGRVPEPDEVPGPQEQGMVREFLLRTGNLEMQQLNTGIMGFKTEGVKALDERIGSAAARETHRGGSAGVSE